MTRISPLSASNNVLPIYSVYRLADTPDPMSSSNPYAATSSQRGYDTGKSKSKKKWWIIGGIIALLIVIGAVLGGVLGTQLNKKNGNSSSGSGTNSGAAAGNGNVVPSGLTGSINTGALTATAANRVLAVATDSAWMLPVYPTGVSIFSWFRAERGRGGSSVYYACVTRVSANYRPTPPATLHLLPTLPPVLGHPTHLLHQTPRSEPTHVSLLRDTSGTL